VSRPKAPLDLANAQALSRIASLASCVLVSLREPGRHRYESERQLASFLSDDGIAFTTADLSPALTLLEITGRLIRPVVKQNAPRPGWLPVAPDQPVWSSPGVDSETASDSTALEAAPEAADAPARFSPETERHGVYLSRKIHLEGTQTRYRVEQIP
jgi:hypothetical protein